MLDTWKKAMSFRRPPPGIIEKDVTTHKSMAIAYKIAETLDQSELQRLAPFHYVRLKHSKAQGRDRNILESYLIASCASAVLKKLQKDAEKHAQRLNRALSMQRPHLARGVLLDLIQAFIHLQHLAERLQTSWVTGFQMLIQRLIHLEHVLTLRVSAQEQPEHPPPTPLARQPKIQPNAPNLVA